MKDNKTIEIVFLKNESRTMIIFVSESQSQNMSILGRSLDFTRVITVKKQNYRLAQIVKAREVDSSKKSCSHKEKFRKSCRATCGQAQRDRSWS